MQRRKFLRSATATAVGTTLLAGCGSPGPGVNETETETGDGIVETETEMGETETETSAETETETDETETETSTETETETSTETGTTGGSLDMEGTVGVIPEGIEVSNTELSRADGNARVTGVIENTGDQMFEEVEVQVTLLDDNDEILGQFFHDTEEAEVSSLEPGATWEFSIEFSEEDLEDAASYRIDVDTDIDENVEFEVGTETQTTTGG